MRDYDEARAAPIDHSSKVVPDTFYQSNPPSASDRRAVNKYQRRKQTTSKAVTEKISSKYLSEAHIWLIK